MSRARGGGRKPTATRLKLLRNTPSKRDELLAHTVADLSPVEELDLGLSGFGEDELAKLLRSLDGRERNEDFDLGAALETRAPPSP